MLLIDIRQQLACVLGTITGWCGTIPYDKHEEDDLFEINDAEYQKRKEMEVINNGTD
jgi:hypothetical protein